MIQNINNFEDVYEYTKNMTSKEKGDLFEIITKYVFLVHPMYSHITKNIWLYNEIPITIKQKFKLPSKDKGIDLILETKDGYYAIQCKFRTNIYGSITWTELSTFAGQLFVGSFKNAIYVTNTYDVDNEILKCDKIQCVYGDFFKDLNKDFFDNVINIINNKKIV